MAEHFYSDIYLNANTIGRDADNLIDFTTDNNVVFRVSGADEITLAANEFSPTTSDGIALGTGSKMWSDLFLASGSVVNFNNGDMTMTHSSNLLTIDGGKVKIANTSEATDSTGDTGALRVEGGISCAGHIYAEGLLSQMGRSETDSETSRIYPFGHYTTGKEVFSIDPTWTESQLQEYFDDTNVTWATETDAPAGWSILLTGAVNVGYPYNSGFPMIPIDETSIYFTECWIKNVGTDQTHYMGSAEKDEDFANPSSGQGNTGTYGYHVMSNYNPGNSWTRVTGHITGRSDSSSGNFETDANYFSPLALFNYGAGSGTRACIISGWRIIKIDKQEYFGDGTAALPSIANYDDPDTGIYWNAANELSLTTGGTNRMTINSTGATFAGDVTVGDDVFVADDGVINVGTGNDLKLYHTGGHSYINNATGNFGLHGVSGGNLILGEGTTNYLTIDGSAGKVVINATSGLMIGSQYTFPTDNGDPNQVLTTDGSGGVTWEDASGGGSGSMTTVKNGGSQVGGADIVTLDFGTGITATESPDTEINIALDAAQTVITSLLATDIKIGEDDQTKIDFETADEIHFYAANAEQVYVADGIFGPQTDSDVDLGSGGVRWKDGYFDSITTTGLSVSSTASEEPVVLIQNRTNDATCGTLKFDATRGADAQDEDLLGKIEFWGFDDGTPSVQQYANIKAEIRDASDGAEEGKLYMQVASHDGEMVTGMALQSGNLEDEVDVILGNGASSTVTIKGSLVIGSTTLPTSALQGQITARTIGGVSFDGSADIDLPGVNAVGNQNTSGSAATLTTTRAFQTNLGSTSTANFDGSATCSPGVTGTLAVGNGGTGVTTMTALKNALDDETWTFANNITGTLATAAQTNITSLGTLTALTVDDINLNAKTLTITGDTSDTFTIVAGAAGATTLTTTDAGGAAGHFEVAADGNIILDANGALSFEMVDGDYTSFKNGSNTYAHFFAEDGANTELRLMERGGSTDDDYLSVSVGTHGATTLTTVDAAAAAAHFEIAADGNITLDAAGNVAIEATTTSVDGILDLTGTTDSSDASGDTGILRCEGGASIAKKLYAGSTITGSADVIAYSDKKLKENIKTLDGKKVLEMRGVSFDRVDTGKASSGVIAQEMEKVAPELVIDDGNYKGVAYGNIVGYLIEAIKDQQKQIDELKEICNGCSK